MKEVAISEFKAKCLALVAQVEKTKHPIRITRFGKPVAEVIPPSAQAPENWIGSMKDKLRFSGTSFLRPMMKATGRRCGIETAPGYPHLAMELAGLAKVGQKSPARVAQSRK